MSKCYWRRFDHEQNEGCWSHQYEQSNYLLVTAPHATSELAVTIADDKEEYVCYGGM